MTQHVRIIMSGGTIIVASKSGKLSEVIEHFITLETKSDFMETMVISDSSIAIGETSEV